MVFPSFVWSPRGDSNFHFILPMTSCSRQNGSLFPHLTVGRPTPRCSSDQMRAQSCQLLCHPIFCTPPGSSVHWIFQARILEWVAISFSRMLINQFKSIGLEARVLIPILYTDIKLSNFLDYSSCCSHLQHMSCQKHSQNKIHLFFSSEGIINEPEMIR